MKHILLVEDDREISRNLALLLQGEGYAVSAAATQAQAIALAAAQRFDLALIDLNLPDGSGYAVCTALQQTQGVPVIFLTASGDEASVVTGLNMGAVDYITKPFRPRELVARIQAALRRTGRAPQVFTRGVLTVDTDSGIVKISGQEVPLSALEYRLLLVFVNNPNGIITRDRLLDELWDAAGEFVTNNALTVYIKRLREKLGDAPAAPRLILTVRGTGYRLGDGHAAE